MSGNGGYKQGESSLIQLAKETKRAHDERNRIIETGIKKYEESTEENLIFNSSRLVFLIALADRQYNEEITNISRKYYDLAKEGLVISLAPTEEQ